MKRYKDLINNVKEYLIDYPDEHIKVQRVLDFINNHDNCFTRDNWFGHFTGSAWVVDNTRAWVLMTHHVQLNMWLQLGGHAEGNSNLLSVAIKEAEEETGLNNFSVLSEKIFDIDIHQIPDYEGSPSHLHFDIRYILEAKLEKEKLIASDESHEVAWIKKNDVTSKNPEESISRMLKKMKKY
tara:strand:- start:126 stop:671 length:546 start_codon:yes stop_codon:yes gene_type:complete